MEICFVPDNDYRGFLTQSKLVGVDPGDIVDLQGKVLGRHDGVAFYTIGQRRGLGLSSPEPLYVLELDAKLNRVVVGPSMPSTSLPSSSIAAIGSLLNISRSRSK